MASAQGELASLLGIPAASQAWMLNGSPLSPSSQALLSTLKIGADDILLVLQRPGAPSGAPPVSRGQGQPALAGNSVEAMRQQFLSNPALLAQLQAVTCLLESTGPKDLNTAFKSRVTPNWPTLSSITRKDLHKSCSSFNCSSKKWQPW